MISAVFSAGIVVLLLLWGRPILGLIFGRVEEDVMEACVTYLRISAYGVEQGIFQFVKVALSSIVALFGTYQIAANGIAQSI